MDKVFEWLGGRKMGLALLGIIALSSSSFLGLDAETQDRIIYLALGAAGAIALEDGAKGFNKKNGGE